MRLFFQKTQKMIVEGASLHAARCCTIFTLCFEVAVIPRLLSSFDSRCRVCCLLSHSSTTTKLRTLQYTQNT